MPLPSPANCRLIAAAASNNPRTIRSILTVVWDVFFVTEAGNFEAATYEYDRTEALEWLGLTPDGLAQTCRRYLVALLTEFGGSAGQRTLQDRLQEPGDLGYTERLLQDKA